MTLLTDKFSEAIHVIWGSLGIGDSFVNWIRVAVDNTLSDIFCVGSEVPQGSKTLIIMFLRQFGLPQM